MTYDQAMKKVASLGSYESDTNVLDECISTAMTHGAKTARAVVMFHGLTACPAQFKELARLFYDAGYNVYIPKAPYHGTANKKTHGGVTASGLGEYANTSITIGTGLGDEVGVVGLSGGGAVATWATEYRPEVTRLLLLSPFYEPAASQAPKWQLPLLHVLYGMHILPDRFVENNGTLFSYRALANYDIVTKNLKSNPSGLHLTNLGLITTPNDTQIDMDLATQIPQKIAHSNKLQYIETSLPKDWGVEHDVVTPTNTRVAPHKDRLYKLFFDTYEGRATQL